MIEYDPNEIMRALDQSMETDVRRISTVALREMTFGTPVGDPLGWAPSSLPPPPGYVGGRARGSWQVSIGGPAPGNTLADANGQQQRDRSGRRTVARGNAVISRYRKRGRRFPRVFVMSDIPYMNRLNLGHSRQVSPGWIDRGVIRAARSVRGRQVL